MESLTPTHEFPAPHAAPVCARAGLRATHTHRRFQDTRPRVSTRTHGFPDLVGERVELVHARDVPPHLWPARRRLQARRAIMSRPSSAPDTRRRTPRERRERERERA
eukprot:301568-Rhodomonas_salina.1